MQRRKANHHSADSAASVAASSLSLARCSSRLLRMASPRCWLESTRAVVRTLLTTSPVSGASPYWHPELENMNMDAPLQKSKIDNENDELNTQKSRAHRPDKYGQ
jgi:hypothetical protein